MSNDDTAYLYEILTGPALVDEHPWDSLTPAQQAAWVPVAEAFAAARVQMPAWQEWNDSEGTFEQFSADGRSWFDRD